MGACLSCLFGSGDDTDANERTSLLGNNNLYSDEDLQEELWKQQQRQNELNNIVNDLNEHLIDVSTFLGSNGTANGVNTTPNPGSSIASPRIHDTDDNEVSAAASPSVGPAGLEMTNRQYPHLLGVEEKLQILKAVERLGPNERKCEIEKASGPLYVVF